MRARHDVRLITGAVGISALGDFLLWVPLTLYLQETTGSGLAVAALFIALWSPVVLLAPLAGLLVDRREARSVLIAASLAQALAAAALGFALESTAAILVLAVLLGIGNAISQPAEFALVPVIGRGRELTQLNGYIESARYGGALMGPVLGGLLVAVGGTGTAMFINAASFVAVAVAAALLHARRPGAAAPADGAAPERARDGVLFLLRDRTLALVIGVVFVSLLFMTASATAEVFFLREDLQVSESLYGLLFGCWMIGMVGGALVVARRVPAAAVPVAAIVFVGVQGAGLGLPTVWLAVGFAGAMWFIGGIGHGTKNVLARTMIQLRVPDHLHGRAFAAYNGLRNAAELVALAGGGALVALLGGRVTLAIAGAVPVIAVLVGLGLYRARRAAEPPVREPVAATSV